MFFLLGFLVEETPCEHGENTQTPHRKAREIAHLSTEGLGRTCKLHTHTHTHCNVFRYRQNRNPKARQTQNVVLRSFTLLYHNRVKPWTAAQCFTNTTGKQAESKPGDPSVQQTIRQGAGRVIRNRCAGRQGQNRALTSYSTHSHKQDAAEAVLA